MKRISSLIVLIVFISAQFSPLFAEQIELTDNELDQIHAGGLNFDFDNYYGSLGQTVSNTPQTSGLTTNTGTNPIGANPGGNQKVTILSPFQTKNVSQPSSVNTPTTVVNTSVPKSPLQVAEAKPNELPSAVETVLPTTTSEAPVNPNQSNLPVTTNLSNDISTAIESNPNFTPNETQSGNIAPDQVNAFSATESSVAAQSSIVPTSDQTQIAAVNVPAVETPDAPKTPASSTNIPEPPAETKGTNTVTPAMIFDVVAGNNSKGNFQVSVNSNADLSKSISPTSVSSTAANTQNSLNVSDASQAGLSALVNVNAAGSVVPVLLNLTVIMGDNYGNITNSNDLSISNYTTFQAP